MHIASGRSATRVYGGTVDMHAVFHRHYGCIMSDQADLQVVAPGQETKLG